MKNATLLVLMVTALLPAAGAGHTARFAYTTVAADVTEQTHTVSALQQPLRAEEAWHSFAYGAVATDTILQQNNDANAYSGELPKIVLAELHQQGGNGLQPDTRNAEASRAAAQATTYPDESSPKEVKFITGTWAEVLAKARAENKPIFIDFYATWCGPCKQMDKNEFTNETLADYFQQNFIAYKVDVDRQEAELVQSVNIEAMPTFGFFTPQSKLVFKEVGYTQADALLVLAKMTARYEALYTRVTTGKANDDELHAFLPMAYRADSELFEKHKAGLLKGLTAQKLEDENTWQVFTLVVDDAAMPAFALAIDNAAALNNLHENYLAYVDKTLRNYLTAAAKAGRYTDLVLYKTAMKKLYDALTDLNRPYEYFDWDADSEYYRLRDEDAPFVAYLVKVTDAYEQDNAKHLATNAFQLVQASTEEVHRQKAMAWAERAVQLNRSANNVYTLARVYKLAGRHDKALHTAQQLYDFDLSEEDIEMVDELIAELRN